MISLSGSSRFDSLKARLIEFDIPFERVDAIDGFRIDEKELSTFYDQGRALRKIGRPMSRGEIGNVLSHRKVWRTIIERNLSAALVLEDDAIINYDFRSFWRSAHQIPEHIGFLSLYTQSGRVFQRPTAVLDEFRLHKAAIGLPNTVAYVISSSYAQMLINRSTRVEHPTDWPLSYLDREQYLALPMPVSHSYDNSIIEPDRSTAIKQQRKPIKTLWPSWIPLWFRAIAYVTCIVYLLRPDRYGGFAEYFKQQVALPLRLALRDTVTVNELKRGRGKMPSE